MRRRAAVAAALAGPAILLAAAGWWWQYHSGKSPSSGSPDAPVVVETAHPATMKLPRVVAAVGPLRAQRAVMVRTEVAGRIAAILFQEGETVAKGQVLVRLDDAARKAELQKARGRLKAATSSYQRALGLRDKGFLPDESLEASLRDVAAAKAEVNRAQARVARTEIRAPSAGIVGLRGVAVGDEVAEGRDIVNLEAFDPLTLELTLSEPAAGLVRHGQRLRITVDALARQGYEGRVTAIERAMDGRDLDATVRLRVRNRDGRLRPGMAARILMPIGGSADALVLPERAIYAHGTEEFVYKAIDGKAVRANVRTGQYADGRVEIVEGVAPADEVVTAASGSLRDGARIAIKSGTAPITRIERCAQCALREAA